MADNIPAMERFRDEAEALDVALARSRGFGFAVSVIESPEQPDENGEVYGGGRWIVEDGDGGMVRGWERLVATFDSGKKIA